VFLSRSRFVVVSLVVMGGVFGTACSDTGVVLKISGNQPSGRLDSLCVELDAGGAARFGRRYDLGLHPLPQTLTAVSQSRDAVQILATGIARGQPVVRDRRNVGFRNGEVLEVNLTLNACLPSPTEGRFQLVKSLSGAVDRALLLPSALGVGGVAVAFAAGQAARYQASAAGVEPMSGVASTSTAAIVGLSVADLDGDCRADLLLSPVSGAPLRLPRAPDGTFPIASSLTAPDGALFAAGDVNGDGSVDLASAAGGEVHLYLNDGQAMFRELDGAFDSAPVSASAVLLGDLDGDGDLDALVTEHGAPPRVYLSDGSGHFVHSPAALPPRSLQVTAAALADLDGDGDLDLVVSTIGDGVRIYLNRGDGFLEDRSFALLGSAATTDVPGILVGDLDGDCLPDLLVAGVTPLLLLSAGQGRLVAGPPLGVGEIGGAASEDVDGDGRPDLLLYGPRGLELLVQR
jgi:hypothetical protein